MLNGFKYSGSVDLRRQTHRHYSVVNYSDPVIDAKITYAGFIYNDFLRRSIVPNQQAVFVYFQNSGTHKHNYHLVNTCSIYFML